MRGREKRERKEEIERRKRRMGEGERGEIE